MPIKKRVHWRNYEAGYDVGELEPTSREARTYVLQEYFVPEKVFGRLITNSDGREVSVRSVCEQHVEEDFGGFIPTAQDWIQAMDYQNWMSNGRTHTPPSMKRIEKDKKVERVMRFDND